MSRPYVDPSAAIESGWPRSSDPESIDLARAYAVSLCHRRPDLIDDMIGVALLSVLDAERTFKVDGGSSWTNHLKRRVWGDVKDALGKEHRRGFCGAADGTPVKPAVPMPKGLDVLDEEDTTRRIDDADECEVIRRWLGDERLELAELATYHGGPFGAADRLGVSKQAAGKRVRAVLADARERFEGSR
jgi:hypothetical protein